MILGKKKRNKNIEKAIKKTLSDLTVGERAVILADVKHDRISQFFINRIIEKL